MSQLVQIIINTTHLEQACRYLEDFITNITTVSPEAVHTTRLYGLSTFKVPLSPRIEASRLSTSASGQWSVPVLSAPDDSPSTTPGRSPSGPSRFVPVPVARVGLWV